MSCAALPPPPSLRAAEVALFLDVDGTLIEIEHDPEAVDVPASLITLLERLQRATGGALALVSGRSLEQLDRLFAPLRLSAAGLHGLERRNLEVGTVRADPRPEIFERARDRLAAFAEGRPGVLLEDKGLTLALHYRRAPEQQAAAAAEMRAIAEASEEAFMVLEGKMVFELKPPGADKGRAIADFMAEPPFAGRRPVFAGDDVTDEAGFRRVNAMAGITVHVGSRTRVTAAAFDLSDVPATHAWLEGLAEIDPPPETGTA